MDDLSQRIQRATESLLENEALTIELDSEAADELLIWGQDCIKRMAQQTLGLGDAEAEEAMAPRMKAMRRLMRQLNRWFANQQEAGTDPVPMPLEKMLEQAAIIYGEAVSLPEVGQLQTFMAQTITASTSAKELIVALRQYIEAPQKTG